MAFNYNDLKKKLSKISAIGGFDRELEFTFFKEGISIGYIDDLLVYDEKVQSYKGFSNQRRRWMSAQVHYLVKFIGYLPSEIAKKHWDFCDKLFQHIL